MFTNLGRLAALAGTAALLGLPAPTAAQGDTNATLAYPRQRGTDYDYTGFEQNQTVRAQAVVDMFRFAWEGYQTYAFPNDELRPQNNSFTNSRNGWGVTAFDALSTAIVMEQTDIVNFILEYVPTVDFSQTVTPRGGVVSLFETNIRYFAGMLGAYDLLKGPFSHLAVNATLVDALLTQATALADVLKFAFDTPSGIPVNSLYIENQTFSDNSLADDNVTYMAGLAELGSLQIEWQRLSDLTGDPQYGELAQRAESYFLRPSGEIWPGLTGGLFNTTSGAIIDEYGGWTSGNDSAYEYLVKMYAYDPERYGLYGERFTAAADSSIAHVLSSPTSRPDLTTVATWGPGGQTRNYSEFLACFVGGSFILGSSVLDRPDWLPYGLDFAEWCANGYRYAASGIGPTLYSWDLEELAEPNNANQTALYERAGWFIPGPYFPGGQAPEAVESWYYAYRATGDPYWRDVAWAYVLAQNATLRVGSGFGSINNVLDPSGGGSRSSMQSFMLAEVLKYQWLIQTEAEGEFHVLAGTPGSGNYTNYFVYNTEAHPIRVAAKNPI